MEKVVDIFEKLINLRERRKVLHVTVCLVILNFILVGLISLINSFIIHDYLSNEKFYFSLSEIYGNFVKNILPYKLEIFAVILLEELIFRFPIVFFINKNIGQRNKIYLIFGLSVLFSLSHMIYFDLVEVLTVFVPMLVTGLIYSLIFVVSGANNGKILSPIFTVFMIHLIWNLVAFSVLGGPNFS